MAESRRNVLKLAIGAGAASLVDFRAAAAILPATGEAGSKESTLLARALPLHAIRLTGGPLKRAQDADRKYLLALEPDRMLAYYRQVAGLQAKAKPYSGWDGGGHNLTGHIAGHYLSAVSAMWAATGDDRFKVRADYIVDELEIVQKKHGDGYLSALEGGRKCFDALAKGEIRSASFNLNGEWSPWYTLHKTFAGLRDAYRYTGNLTALELETKFADWAARVLRNLTPRQLQEMMETEFGGMNEVLVDLYADTGDARWLRLSYSFEHTAFIEPLQRHEDRLDGLHANTQVPKLLGSAARFLRTGQPGDLVAASFFFDRVAQHHSFASGGHGTDEYFGPADHLGDRVHGRTAESCNVYNMLRLARLLFSIAPDAHYADFHERALFNHAMASFDPDAGRMCYMVPVGPGVTHEYQDMFESFTCCVGTGMENHALAGDGIYYEAGDKLWVNLYAPSTAEWPQTGLRLTMESDLPEGESAKLSVTVATPRELTLALRRPHWAGEGFAIRVNGQPVEVERDAVIAAPGLRRQPYGATASTSSYVEIARTWRSGDVVEIALPKTLRLERTPDMPGRASILWGPLVLAGDLGPEPPLGTEAGPDGEVEPVDMEPPLAPVFVVADRPVSDWIAPVADEVGRFRTRGVGHLPDAEGAAREVDLLPFYRLHKRTYSTYWDLATPAEFAAQKAEHGREAERQRRLEAASVSFLRPGDRAAEPGFNYRGGDDAERQHIRGRSGRSARSWFAYDLPVDPARAMALVATYYTADRRTSPAKFAILVDGQRLTEQAIERTDPGRFFDVLYPVPAEMVEGKSKVTVRFQASEGSQIAAVFGLRIVRADELS